MNCAQVKEQLVDFLYEEMPAETRASFAEHLRGCPACSADLASYQRTLGQARAALGGPLAQEPPARVHLAVLAAAQAAAAKPAPAKRSARTDEPGFFARLMRTPWLLPAFGAASIATAVFLVRVLKNPEVIPGQQARSIDERALVAPVATAPAPMAPSATVSAPDENRALAGNKLEEVAGTAARSPSRTKAGDGKRTAKAAATAPAPEPVAPALIKTKKSLNNDLLDGLSLSGAGQASGAGRRFAEPPPPPYAQGALEKDRDDLLNSATEERKARQPEAQVAEKPADRKAPTLSLDQFAPAGDRDKISKITSKQLYPKGEFAEPPPSTAPPTPKSTQRTHASDFATPPSSPAAAPAYAREEAAAPPAPKTAYAKPKTDSYAPAGASAPASTTALPTPSPPASQAKRARAEVVSDESKSEYEAAAKNKTDKRSSDASPTLEESEKKADRLYASQDWNAATAAYRDLLRRFPSHKDAPKWRDRMNESNVAYQRTLEAKRKKAVTDDPLNGLKL
jgi:anti-sigma factor RsiW